MAIYCAIFTSHKSARFAVLCMGNFDSQATSFKLTARDLSSGITLPAPMGEMPKLYPLGRDRHPVAAAVDLNFKENLVTRRWCTETLSSQ